MKTKNIFKALALAMLMPAMVLTTACSKDDDTVNNNEPARKGYSIPVTVNVTRQGGDATRATYNGTSKKLSFGEGDKLFVKGYKAGIGDYAGLLTWQEGGTFSGTIETFYPYSGTADELLSSTNIPNATLLPNGYETYGYINIFYVNEGNDYSRGVNQDPTKAFAATKALAVEQFSLENTTTYSNGFTLSPKNAILCITLTGLTPNATDIPVSVKDDFQNEIAGTVSTDADGKATFAVGIRDNPTYINELTLKVGDNDVTLPNGGTQLKAGKIYNITVGTAG